VPPGSKEGAVKFAQPIEEKLSDDISLFVPSAWLNPKGLPMAECQLWNGTLLFGDTLCVANHSARARFIKSALQRVDLPANKIEEVLLLISGNLTTTLADSLTEDATADARPSQATQLIQLAEDVEFFHTKEGDAYATVKVGNHKETFQVKVKPFRRYLMRRYYEKTKSSVSAQAVQDGLGVLEGRALFDGPELPVFTRLAESEGSIYLDLCNDKWEAVE